MSTDMKKEILSPGQPADFFSVLCSLFHGYHCLKKKNEKIKRKKERT